MKRKSEGKTGSAFCLKALITSSAADIVTGNNGQWLTAVCLTTRAQVQISGEFFPGTSERVVMLNGDVYSVKEALKKVIELIETDYRSRTSESVQDLSLALVLPMDAVKLMAADGGARCHTIEESTQVKLQAIDSTDQARKRCYESLLLFRGTVQALFEAADLVIDEITEHSPFAAYQNPTVSYSGFSAAAEFDEEETGSPQHRGRQWLYEKEQQDEKKAKISDPAVPDGDSESARQDKNDCTLFVGNVSPRIDGIALQLFLNLALRKYGLVTQPGDAVVSVVRHTDNYAFIVMRSAEEASACLHLTGIPMEDTFLKIRRHSAYSGPADPPAKTWAVLAGVDPEEQRAGKLNRTLFVGSLTSEMSADGIQKHLGAEAEMFKLTVKSGNPVYKVTLKPGGYAFVEIRSEEETTNMLSLDGVPYMGTQLRIKRPSKFEGPHESPIKWEDLMARNVFRGGRPGPPAGMNFLDPHSVLGRLPPGPNMAFDPQPPFGRPVPSPHLSFANPQPPFAPVGKGEDRDERNSEFGGHDYASQVFMKNVPVEAHPDDILGFLNAALRQYNLNVRPGDAILSCRIMPPNVANPRSLIGFLNLRGHEETTNCLNMDGIPFKGKELQLSRPAKYTGPTTPAVTWKDLVASQQTNMTIYVGNLAAGVVEPALQEFLNAAMDLYGLSLSPGNPITKVVIGASKIFGFAELRSPQEASNMLRMNGLPFMGMRLTLSRPTNYAGPPDPPSNWTDLVPRKQLGDLSGISSTQQATAILPSATQPPAILPATNQTSTAHASNSMGSSWVGSQESETFSMASLTSVDPKMLENPEFLASCLTAVQQQMGQLQQLTAALVKLQQEHSPKRAPQAPSAPPAAAQPNSAQQQLLSLLAGLQGSSSTNYSAQQSTAPMQTPAVSNYPSQQSSGSSQNNNFSSQQLSSSQPAATSLSMLLQQQFQQTSRPPAPQVPSFVQQSPAQVNTTPDPAKQLAALQQLLKSSANSQAQSTSAPPASLHAQLQQLPQGTVRTQTQSTPAPAQSNPQQQVDLSSLIRMLASQNASRKS